jgi:hypothetical protein
MLQYDGQTPINTTADCSSAGVLVSEVMRGLSCINRLGTNPILWAQKFTKILLDRERCGCYFNDGSLEGRAVFLNTEEILPPRKVMEDRFLGGRSCFAVHRGKQYRFGHVGVDFYPT